MLSLLEYALGEATVGDFYVKAKEPVDGFCWKLC